MRQSTRLFLAVLLFFLIPAARADDYTAPGVTLTVGDPNGVRPKPLAELEVGDSLAVAVTGANPHTPVEMRLEDALGREWSYSRVTSDERGEVPQTLFWYQTGVIGTTTRRGAFRPDPAFLTFDEGERFFADHALQLTVTETGGRLLATREVRPRPRTTAYVYPSNAAGVLENAVNAQEEALYVTGRNFPAGATVQLFLVPNRFGYGVGDPFEPVNDAVRTITLERGQTGFTAELVPRTRLMKGSYDIIARAGNRAEWEVQAGDVISFGEETGVVAYITKIGDHWVLANSSGRLEASPADFEYSGSFEKGEDIWVAIDPTDIPENHAGGIYAATWIIENQNWFWYAANPILTDVNDTPSSHGAEIHRVKANSLGLTRKRVWAGATHDKPVKSYDVVVDFGFNKANTSSQFVWDNKYNKGLDFVDGYYGPAFLVSEEPGAEGKFKVGVVDLLDENGISGIPGPPLSPVQLAWARIMYPATEAGTKKPVASGGPFPIVLFLHGNHDRCDPDGPGPSMANLGNLPCPAGLRVPSHLGYDYIMKKLASQGFFCISISAHDLQVWDGDKNIDSRGRLVLKYLDKIRGWNENGGDPWNSLFKSKLDLTRIGLSGHSRGGEGVAAAERLNDTWPTKHSIKAIAAMAPTDIEAGASWVPRVPYFVLVGARDGDVTDMHGFRTYDRVFTNPNQPWDVKTAAYVYGANHNFFNTIWTPAEDLGELAFWSGARDECKPFAVFTPETMMSCKDKMLAPTQRQIALSTIAAFFRWQLQGVIGYREVFTGVLKPKAMQNDKVFWSFQDGTRKVVDHFEKTPSDDYDETENSLGGQVTTTVFTTHSQRLFNRGGSQVIDPPDKTETAFVHDTVGLLLKYSTDETYTTRIPLGERDVSGFTHLTLRVARKTTLLPPIPFPNVKLEVNIVDGAGNTAAMPADLLENFTVIPHPFVGSFEPNLSQMVSVRIPLQYFTANGSGVDLTDVARIIITTKGADTIGIDDIEFGK